MSESGQACKEFMEIIAPAMAKQEGMTYEHKVDDQMVKNG